MKLETITSGPFVALLDQSCWIEVDNGSLELTVTKVSENPKAALPNARRIPFLVLLRGPESPALIDGACAVRVDGPGGWRLEGVYINRIMPPLDLAPGAYYQMIFN